MELVVIVSMKSMQLHARQAVLVYRPFIIFQQRNRIVFIVA